MGLNTAKLLLDKMLKVTQNILNKMSQAKELKLKNGIAVLNKLWNGPNSTFTSTSKEEIETILAARFPSAKSIEVKDVTGGDGAIYEIFVEDSHFEGLPIVKQHQVITDTLKQQIKLMHGVRIITKTPS